MTTYKRRGRNDIRAVQFIRPADPSLPRGIVPEYFVDDGRRRILDTNWLVPQADVDGQSVPDEIMTNAEFNRFFEIDQP